MNIDIEKVKNGFLRFLKAAWKYIKKARIELTVLASALAVDLISKIIVDSAMRLGQTVVLIPNFLEFYYTHNYLAAFGSFFGMGPSPASRAILITITTLASCFLCWFMYKCRNKGKFLRITLALMIGGALGNLADRMFLGYVRDFIQIRYFGLTIFNSDTFAIFNLADSALTVSVVMMAVWIIFFYDADGKKAKSAKTPAESVKEQLYDADGNPVEDDSTTSAEQQSPQQDSGAIDNDNTM